MKRIYLLMNMLCPGWRALTFGLALLVLTGFFASAGATYDLHSSSSAVFAAGAKKRAGGGSTQPSKGAAHGERAYKPFTPKGKEEVRAENAQNHGGTNHCENCGVQTVPAQQSKKGVTPPPAETQVDHVIPRAKGGDGSPENGQVLCRDCNNKKGDKDG